MSLRTYIIHYALDLVMYEHVMRSNPKNINDCRKMTSCSVLPTKYLVYRSIGGQRAVKD